MVKTRIFLSRTWEKDLKHNKSADWIQKVAEEMLGNMRQIIEIAPTQMK